MNDLQIETPWTTADEVTRGLAALETTFEDAFPGTWPELIEAEA